MSTTETYNVNDRDKWQRLSLSHDNGYGNVVVVDRGFYIDGPAMFIKLGDKMIYRIATVTLEPTGITCDELGIEQPVRWQHEKVETP